MPALGTKFNASGQTFCRIAQNLPNPTGLARPTGKCRQSRQERVAIPVCTETAGRLGPARMPPLRQAALARARVPVDEPRCLRSLRVVRPERRVPRRNHSRFEAGRTSGAFSRKRVGGPSVSREGPVRGEPSTGLPEPVAGHTVPLEGRDKRACRPRPSHAVRSASR